MRFVKTAENLFSLPQGFTRVEYLESTTGQYIDTGVGVKSNTVVKAVFSITSGVQGKSYFGARNSTNERFQIVNSFGVGAGYFYNTNVYPIANKQFEIEMHASGEVYLDGIKRDATNGTFSAVAFDRTLYIFHTNYYDGSGTPTSSKFWKVQILEGDTLVRDYIPALDSNNRPCMYDRVEGKPYYNIATTDDDFSYGKQIIPVEYLESTGEQYIDTGYKPVPATTKFEFYFNPTTISGNYFLFGARPDTSIGGFTCTTYFATGNIRQDWAGLGSYFTKINVGDKVLYSAYNNTVSLNNDSATGTVTRSTDRLDYNFLLFTVNTAGTADSRRYIGRVYYSKLWDDGTLVRDFIPCKDENEVGFMFDSVSGTVYENKGTGAFVVGNNKYKMKLRLIKDNILPTGYTQVEYLESSGTQWIDTGIKGTQDTEIQCGFNVLDYTQTNYISLMGYVGNSNESISVFLGRNSGNGRTRFGNANTLDTAVSLNTRYDLIINKSKLQLNSNVLSWDCTNTFTTEGNLLLFKRNSETYGNFIGRIRCCKIYDNDTPTRDFIPAIDQSGVPCMYDLVSRTPFYNAGTGTFTTGKPVLPVVRFVKDILPDGYKAVNYLESSGTQYIDTGFKPNPATTKIDCAFCGFSGGSTQMFGARTVASSSNENNTNICFGPVGGKIYIRGDWIRQNNNLVTDIEPEEYIHLIAHNQTVSINGTEYSSTLEKNNTYVDYNFCLFACNTAGTIQFYSKIRQYYFKIYDNNTIVRNFIPVVRLLDNKAGMWDTVTKQFYTTPTGAFITG